MKRLALGLLILVCFTSVAWAQDCGNGLPCGPLPWRLPSLPNLASPTPFPTAVITATPSITPTLTGTVPSPTPAPTNGIDIIGDSFATLQHVSEATPGAAATEDVYQLNDADIDGNLQLIFAFSRFLQGYQFGVFTPLMTLLVFFFFSALGFALLDVIVPLIPALVAIVRKFLQLVSAAISAIAGLIRR